MISNAQISEILNRAKVGPDFYLWHKPKPKYTKEDWDNLSKLDAGMEVEDPKFKKSPTTGNWYQGVKGQKQQPISIVVTKNGKSEIFNSLQDFANDPRILVKESSVSNALSKGHKIKGYIIEKIK